mgnify:CR=1 FL=1
MNEPNEAELKLAFEIADEIDDLFAPRNMTADTLARKFIAPRLAARRDDGELAKALREIAGNDDPHEAVGIARAELVTPVERQLDGRQRHLQAVPESAVSGEPPPVMHRVEVAGDGP